MRLHDLHIYPKVQSLFSHVDPRVRNDSVVATIFVELRRRLHQLDREAEQYSAGPLGDTVFDGKAFSVVDCCLPGTLLLAQRLAVTLRQPPLLASSGRLQRWLAAVRIHVSLIKVIAELETAVDEWLRRKLSCDDHAFEADWWNVGRHSYTQCHTCSLDDEISASPAVATAAASVAVVAAKSAVETDAQSRSICSGVRMESCAGWVACVLAVFSVLRGRYVK